MKKLFFAALIAALPPLAQSTREMQAVLSDARFYESLGSAEQVKDIIRTETGFLVLTQNYAMRVDLKYEQREQQFVGPAQFSLEFHPPLNLKSGEIKTFPASEPSN